MKDMKKIIKQIIKEGDYDCIKTGCDDGGELVKLSFYSEDGTLESYHPDGTIYNEED